MQYHYVLIDIQLYESKTILLDSKRRKHKHINPSQMCYIDISNILRWGSHTECVQKARASCIEQFGIDLGLDGLTGTRFLNNNMFVTLATPSPIRPILMLNLLPHFFNTEDNIAKCIPSLLHHCMQHADSQGVASCQQGQGLLRDGTNDNLQLLQTWIVRMGMEVGVSPRERERELLGYVWFIGHE